MKWWLGVSLTTPSVSATCPSCGDALDSFGDHLLCCRKGGFYQRHTAVVRQLWHMCTAAGLTASCEVSFDGSTRPADLLVPHWKGGGPLANDVSVVHPLAPSQDAQAVRSGTEYQDRVEKSKSRKYAEACAQSNVQFSPFVLSTFGRLGSSSGLLYADLIRATSGHHTERTERAAQFQQQLQLALKREVARMLLQGQALLDEHGGEDFPSDIFGPALTAEQMEGHPEAKGRLQKPEPKWCRSEQALATQRNHSIDSDIDIHTITHIHTRTHANARSQHTTYHSLSHKPW